MIDEYIDDIINLFMLGRCPDCRGKNLDRFCTTCQFFNGISRKEVVENNWDYEDIINILEKRKTQ